MRIKEWYGWHFPELKDIVKDNYQYAKIVKVLPNRNKISKKLSDINKITLDQEITDRILEAAHSSMGQDLSENDLINVNFFAEKYFLPFIN